MRTKPQSATDEETKVAAVLPHEQSPVQQLFRFCLDTACIPVGNAAKLRANLAAIDTLKTVQQQNRPATPHEQ